MFLANLAICVLAGFTGFAVISKVPNTLHTPLNDLLLGVAIAFGAVNVAGGFLVTDRMLGMFKGRGGAKAPAGPGGGRG